jgi:hypothetical protein
MSNHPWEQLTSALVDTGVFIYWFCVPVEEIEVIRFFPAPTSE